MERMGYYGTTTFTLNNRHPLDRCRTLEAEVDALRAENKRLKDANANLALLAVVRDMEQSA